MDYCWVVRLIGWQPLMTDYINIAVGICLYVPHGWAMFLHLSACIYLYGLYRGWNSFKYITWLRHVFIFQWMYLYLCLYWCWDSFIYITFKGLGNCCWLIYFIIIALIFLTVCVLILTCQSDFAIEYGILKEINIRFTHSMPFACLCVRLQVMLDHRIRNCSLKFFI